MQKERIKSLDFLKGLTIFLVVLGHSIQYNLDAPFENPVFNFIYSFHMPLFMFISGFVSFKYVYTFSDIKKRAYQLITPFVFWPILTALLFKGRVEINLYLDLFRDPSLGLWFLLALFYISTFFTLINIIYNCFCKSSNNSDVRFLGVGNCLDVIYISAAVIAYVCLTVLRNGSWGIGFFLRYEFFYLAGLLIRKHLNRIKGVLVRMWLPTLLVFFVLVCFWKFQHHPTFITNPPFIIEALYYYLTAFAGIAMMFTMCTRFVHQTTDNLAVNQIASWGHMTLGIYAIHLELLIHPAVALVKPLGLPVVLDIVLVFMFVFTLSIMIHKFIDMGTLTPQLLLGKIHYK